MIVSKPTLEVVQEHILAILVCTNGKTKAWIEKETNRLSPSGLNSKWRLDKKMDKEYHNDAPVACAEKEGYMHYVLYC